MKVLLIEEKYNLIKTVQNKVEEYTYVDKFNRAMYTRYEISNGNYFDIDIRKKKEKKNLSAPLLYNLYNVLEAMKDNKTIVIVENEKIADFINKKSRKLVCTTILNGIDTDNISEKMLELFRGTNVIVLSYNNRNHNKIMDKLSLVTNSIRNLDINSINIEEESKEICDLFNIMNKFKN